MGRSTQGLTSGVRKIGKSLRRRGEGNTHTNTLEIAHKGRHLFFPLLRAKL